MAEERVPRTDRPEAMRPRPRAAAPRRPVRPRHAAPTTDPIADMLTRLRNGVRARHETVPVPASRLKADIARILKQEGFIAGHEVQGGTLTVRLKYVGGAKTPALTEIRRISRPGLRVYAGRAELPRVRRGLGVTIVSTSRGVMTGADAQKQGLGGEVLCTVY